jgi:hypothetical protein
MERINDGDRVTVDLRSPDEKPVLFGVAESQEHPGRFDVHIIIANFATLEEASVDCKQLSEMFEQHYDCERANDAVTINRRQ